MSRRDEVAEAMIGRRLGEDRDDARDAEWYQFAQLIDELLSLREYQYAEQTLRGIQATVEATARVSVGQARAVHNIITTRPAVRDEWSRRWPWPI